MSQRMPGAVAFFGFGGVLYLLLMWLVPGALLHSCVTSGETTDARVRSALDVLAAVIDPAYALAVDGCIAREDLALAEAKVGRITATAASDEIAAVRLRCDALRETFEGMRLVHSRAAEALEKGLLERAESGLRDLQTMWEQLDTKEIPP